MTHERWLGRQNPADPAGTFASRRMEHDVLEAGMPLACTSRRVLLPLVAIVAMASTACGAHGGATQPAAMGHLTVTKTAGPDDAPEEAKTVTVEYAFDRDLVNRDFEKTFTDSLEKKGVKVDESLTAHAHFDVKDAKITGTVTYVKKGMKYSILDADLVATGHYDADVKVDLDVQVKGDAKKASGDDWDKTLMGGKPMPLVKNVMPTNIPIAGPLFLHTHFDLSAACDIEIDGQMHATTGVGITGDVRLAAKYKKAGFQPETPETKPSKFKFEAKAPGFELAPKPYLDVRGGKQSLKGRCSLQPTAVLLLEHSIGAKLSVEPFVSLEAKRGSTREKWSFETSAGVSGYAATDIEVFGRPIRKPKQHQLFEIALTKPNEAGSAPKTQEPTRGAIASLLDEGLVGSPVSTGGTPARRRRGLFGKKKM